MVKNAGGKRTKSQGRKYVGTTSQKGVRYATQEGEIYAAVTKLFGGDNCEVLCSDGILRMCIIRKKFRGRGKRDNIIAIGVWVLVGLRDWETNNKRQKCDLLEVYSETDKDTLKGNSSLNLTLLCKISEDKMDDNNDDICCIDFVNNNYTEEIKKLTTDSVSAILNKDDSDNDIIDVDDI